MSAFSRQEDGAGGGPGRQQYTVFTGCCMSVFLSVFRTAGAAKRADWRREQWSCRGVITTENCWKVCKEPRRSLTFRVAAVCPALTDRLTDCCTWCFLQWVARLLQTVNWPSPILASFRILRRAYTLTDVTMSDLTGSHSLSSESQIVNQVQFGFCFTFKCGERAIYQQCRF